MRTIILLALALCLSGCTYIAETTMTGDEISVLKKSGDVVLTRKTYISFLAVKPKQ